MTKRWFVVLLVIMVAAAACSSDGDGNDDSSATTAATDESAPTSGEDSGDGADESTPTVATIPEVTIPAHLVDYGPAPETPTGPLDPATVDAVDRFIDSLAEGPDFDALEEAAASRDARLAWLLSDLLRFLGDGPLQEATLSSWEFVTGVELSGQRSPWSETTNHLLAWDTPAVAEYADWKGRIFTLVEPGWAPFFLGDTSAVDWRQLSWGGVLIDDRPLSDVAFPCFEGCIPALDDPGLTSAAEGDWYDDDRVVFGVIVGDEAVALPKHIMEVHEMVNMTIGGRRVGIPYCTLCGSAQAYFIDDVAEGIRTDGHGSYELRTSGLLTRSNKVTYEFFTKSIIDTFTGEALTGPLRDAGVVLEELTVRTARWGEWKAAHPDTKIVARDGGIGRTYLDDPLGDRDADGPIFPIGNADPRLGVQDPVVGVVLDDGTAVAFAVAALETALDAGEVPTVEGLTVETDGAGFSVVDASGDLVVSHQAFWFAWSQFHPETVLWNG